MMMGESSGRLPKSVRLAPLCQEDVRQLSKVPEPAAGDIGGVEGRLIHLQEYDFTSESSGEEVRMESVHHVAQLPAVQQAIGAVGDVYSRVRDSNRLCQTTLQTAESALHDIARSQPVQRCMRDPIRAVDRMLMRGIQCAEETVPAITLPPGQMLERTKVCVATTCKPCVDGISAVKTCSANVVKKVIAVSLQALPDSLLPDGVDRARLAGTPAQVPAEEFQDAEEHIDNPPAQ